MRPIWFVKSPTVAGVGTPTSVWRQRLQRTEVGVPTPATAGKLKDENSMRYTSILFLLAVLINSPSAAVFADDPKPITREVRDVEGWSVRVDDRLLRGDQAELGVKALRVLAHKLDEIKLIMPKDRLAKLQGVTIVLDLNYAPFKKMQYHPSAQWLKDNGHDPKLAKCVHLPQAKELTSRFLVNQQPMAILHELAHAYHDQVLGFDAPKIKAAWARFKESGKYKKVLHISGKEVEHYALTNQMEFFAEMTECFFGTNDYYPFVRGELKKELPEVDKLLEEIWVKEKP